MESGIPTPPTSTGAGENTPTTTTTTTTTTTMTAVPVRRSTTTGGKPTKPVHRVTKRSATQQSRSHISIHDHGPISPPSGVDNRQKRVWKACERCRMKKTKVCALIFLICFSCFSLPIPLSLSVSLSPAKSFSARYLRSIQCDGEFPCKRCRDDGLICTAGVRKKMEYKQLPRGYGVYI
jgi:hypothetical protein